MPSQHREPSRAENNYEDDDERDEREDEDADDQAALDVPIISKLQDLVPHWQAVNREHEITRKRNKKRKERIPVDDDLPQTSTPFAVDDPGSWTAEQALAIFHAIWRAGQVELGSTAYQHRTKPHPSYIRNRDDRRAHSKAIDVMIAGLVSFTSCFGRVGD